MNEETENENEDLLDSDAHQSAANLITTALIDVFVKLDIIGRMNQHVLDDTGKPAVHMTALMMMLMEMTYVNMVARVNDEDRGEFREYVVDFINGEAATMVAQAEAEREHGQSGRA